jgi:hypothetical protein
VLVLGVDKHTAAGEQQLDHAGAAVVRSAQKWRAAASTNGRYAADTTAVYRGSLS